MEAAALALNIDSSNVVKAANDLDKFTAASERAGKAGGGIGNQSGSIAKLVASLQSMDAKLSAIVNGIGKVNSALSTMGKVSQGAAVANDNVARAMGVADAHVIAYTQHIAGLARAQQNANAHVLVYQANLATIAPVMGQADAHVIAYRKSLGQVEEGARKASTAIKFTAQDSLNASRQLADIGVTAAMGMSPFMIAIQQGPQLLDILQNKAAMTGQTLSAVFRAAAASVLAMLAPFLPLIALLTLAAAGIAALTRQANETSGLKKYTTEMGYTKEEVKKLNAVTVTFGDTAKAVFQSALAGAAAAMGTNTKNMAKTWDSFLDYIVSGTRAALAGVYAAIAGTKAYLGEVEKGGVLGIGKMLIGQGDPDLIKKTYGKAYAEAQKGMDAITAQARKNAQARQATMAKGFYDKPNVPKGPKTDAEKFSDIVLRAQAEIEAEKARGEAVGMSARASAELEQKTKLLNDVKKAGIPVTAALTAKVGELAKAYSDAKVAADVAAALEASTESMKQQSAAINDQLSLVGVYGDKLTRARIEAEALTKAIASLPKGETLSPDQYNRVVREAGSVSDDQVNLDRATRAEKIRKDAEDSAYAMDLERRGLGLTGQAALTYAFTVDKLNEAKRAGIALSPDEIAAIEKAADAYGKQRYAIDQQSEALASSREITKGFFSDLIGSVREGGNAFKAFADAAVNSLNRIIDKLLDKGLDALVNGMFTGGGAGAGGGSSSGGFFSSLLGSIGIGGGNAGIPSNGGISKGGWNFDPTIKNALGGVYGSPQRFANGGAFTNQIVNTPTLFRFANGGALGEMGEAGPEAIMPLKRGPNGALGVQMTGGGKPTVKMGDVHLHQSFAGAIGVESIQAMNRQSSQEAVSYIRREFGNIAAEYETNGAFAS